MDVDKPIPARVERKRVTLAEFLEMVKAQGVPIERVTFRCPRCGTLQCAEDLIEAGAGADLDTVEKYLGFSCVGRWSEEKGCDWTLGGLFQIHELEVVTPDERVHPTFMPVGRDDEN